MSVPTATYRLQFRPEFGFEAARQILPYLAELGISHIYASPIFKARSGSSHGYDIADPTQLNPELGTEAEFDALVAEARSRGLGWVQDIVPNHMAYDSQNRFLMDVMEYGPDSDYFSYFDIDWDSPYEDLNGRLLVPMLGEFYGVCLENGQIQLSYDEAGLRVNYYELCLPLRVESYATVLTHDLGHLSRKLGRSHPDVIKMLGLLYSIKSLASDASGRQRRDQAEFVKSLLWELYQSSDDVRAFVDRNLERFNGTVGKPDSFDLLDRLLSEQYFRLAFWKVGAEELNYRRFFTVNELICVRIEDLKVFQQSHALIFKLADEGKIDGLRIDHIDGLYDPETYLKRLRDRLPNCYLLVEKILEPGETLPDRWPIQGTTGYDFLNCAAGLFCPPKNEAAIARTYREVMRRSNRQGAQGFERQMDKNLDATFDNYDALALAKKRLIAATSLAGDADNLARLLKRIAGHSRYGRDFTLPGLKTAILEVLVQFSVYRTYIQSDPPTARDRRYVQIALDGARSQIPQLQKELDSIEKILLLDYESSLGDEERSQWLNFTLKFQQFSGPLTAKGIEDTLFYVYNRLVGLNEVGGSPQHFGTDLQTFHDFCRHRLDRWPHALSATSTHDTKRSEDARLRALAIAELPDDWSRCVDRWQAWNGPHKTQRGDRAIPDANDEYFLYQNLVAAFPWNGQWEEARDGWSGGRSPGNGADADGDLGATPPWETPAWETFCDRVKAFAIKSVREAKVHTAWLRPDEDYEAGFTRFIDRILDPNPENEFLADFHHFQRKTARLALYNSLSQTLLKIAAPGIPDFYQGTELWDLSLVDPDNRRPVNYDDRRSFLQEIQRRTKTGLDSLLDDLMATREDGRLKLFLVARALAARNRQPALFQRGRYLPLTATGARAASVLAFARFDPESGAAAIALVPRQLAAELFDESGAGEERAPLGPDFWGDTALDLPPDLLHPWQDAIAGGPVAAGARLEVGAVLQRFPVALLLGGDRP